MPHTNDERNKAKIFRRAKHLTSWAAKQFDSCFSILCFGAVKAFSLRTLFL
jgi:hypothetical protein